jgi:hypothetical protein
MKTLLSLGVLTTVLALAHGWSKYFDDSIDSWAPSRRSMDECTKSGRKCFASTECCNGFVCAAFDDLFGKNPEVPGYCVREKDLPMCENSNDCPVNHKCRTLARGAIDRYCIERPQEMEEPKVPKFRYPKVKSGLGMKCQDDADCSAYTSNGESQLCCQDVQRGRQGKRRQCDRVTPISKCVTPNA